MSLIAHAAVACRAATLLGEGPAWEETHQTLWFVDITGDALHSFSPATGSLKRWPAPARPSFVLPIADNRLLVGTRDGLQIFDQQLEVFKHIRSIEPHSSGNRLNDACVGPDGALWFGSMHEAELQPKGVLYRLHADHLIEMDRGYIVTNGPAFSPDGRIFYHTDSANRVLFAFDAVLGELLNKRVLIHFQENDGFPDGTTVDVEGCLWIGMWGGGELRRYSPHGKLLGRVEVPATYVTKVAFGGTDLQTAYITTACQPMSELERSAQPHAGDLFTFRSPVPGLGRAKLTLADQH